MIRFSALVPIALAMFIALPVTASAQSQDDDIRRAKVFQIYLKAQDAIGEMLSAEHAFNRARAAGDEDEVAESAGEMLGSSVEAAFWAVVLDKTVQAEATDPRAKELSAELRELTRTAFTVLITDVPDADYDDLERRLDNSADWLNGLHLTVRKIYDLITEKQLQ